MPCVQFGREEGRKAGMAIRVFNTMTGQKEELRPIEALAIRWAFEFGNGRGREPAEILNLKDVNPFKSIGGQLAFSLPDLGLDFGANLLFDTIPESDLHARMAERIIGGFVALEIWKLRLISEIYAIHHAPPTGAAFDTLGGFLEVALRLGAFHPFIRGEWIDFSTEADPFYSANPQSDWVSARAGVRWAAAAHVAIKLEYAFLRELQVGNEHQLRVQLAFAL